MSEIRDQQVTCLLDELTTLQNRNMRSVCHRSGSRASTLYHVMQETTLQCSVYRIEFKASHFALEPFGLGPVVRGYARRIVARRCHWSVDRPEPIRIPLPLCEVTCGYNICHLRCSVIIQHLAPGATEPSLRAVVPVSGGNRERRGRPGDWI